MIFKKIGSFKKYVNELKDKGSKCFVFFHCKKQRMEGSEAKLVSTRFWQYPGSNIGKFGEFMSGNN